MRELSLNMLDIAQNSIAAGATLVTLAVDCDRAADRLTLTVEDNGRGMTAEQLEQVRDPFFTTRTTRKVGMGIPLFRMAAEMAGGGLQIRSAPGVGTTVEAVFTLSHIDRMPLGDMDGTVTALIRRSISFISSPRTAVRHKRTPASCGKSSATCRWTRPRSWNGSTATYGSNRPRYGRRAFDTDESRRAVPPTN